MRRERRERTGQRNNGKREDRGEREREREYDIENANLQEKREKKEDRATRRQHSEGETVRLSGA